MASRNRWREALELLSDAERELVCRILGNGVQVERSSGDPIDGLDDFDFLRVAQLRLRNIVEKHSEALKRARHAARSGRAGHPVESIELQLWICSEALAACRRRLQA